MNEYRQDTGSGDQETQLNIGAHVQGKAGAPIGLRANYEIAN